MLDSSSIEMFDNRASIKYNLSITQEWRWS